MSEPLPLRRFTRFLTAGGINTAFGYVTFALLLWCGLNDELAVTLSTLAGLAFNFGTYRSAFDQSGWARLPHFVIFYGSILAANIVLLGGLTRAGLNPYLGQALVVLLIVPTSYWGLRRLVFQQLRGSLS